MTELAALTEVVEALSEAEVMSWLEQLLAPRRQARLERLAAASYRHAFGFAKLVLLDEPGVCKVRLHAWPSGPRESDIHDHRWSFASRVLRGGYRFEEYALVAGTDWDCYRYLPTGAKAHFQLERLGTRDVECVRRGEVGAGDVYALAVGTAHRVWTRASEPTLSLVVQGRDVCASTTVLTRQRPGGEVPVERLDARRYRACLERICAWLSAAPRIEAGAP